MRLPKYYAMASAGNFFLQLTDCLVSQLYIALPCETVKLNLEMSQAIGLAGYLQLARRHDERNGANNECVGAILEQTS